MSETQIKGYLAFDDADLIANRAGKLSAKQTKKLKELDQWSHNFILWLFVITLAIGLFLTYRAWTGHPGSWVGAVILLLIAFWFSRGLVNKVDESVQRAEGEVVFIKVERLSGSSTDPQSSRHVVSSYEMRVGGEAFANANPALAEYMQGDIYAVYFTKTTKQILSVEFISKGEK